MRLRSLARRLGIEDKSLSAVKEKAACTMTEVDNLEDALRSCDVPMPKQNDVPPAKDRLEATVTASTPSTTPGGRVDLVLTLRNKTDSPLPLYFTGDPNPRFDVEAYDAKGRTRVDIPAGKFPGYPKGWKPEARDAKAARITLEKNGSARVKLAWDAVKMKWAPDKAKRGVPRIARGAEQPRLGRGEQAEFGRIRLAHDDQAGALLARNQFAVVIRHEAAHRHRSGMQRRAGIKREQVFQQKRHAAKRTVGD
jgi:hypothetical protein